MDDKKTVYDYQEPILDISLIRWYIIGFIMLGEAILNLCHFLDPKLFDPDYTKPPDADGY